MYVAAGCLPTVLAPSRPRTGGSVPEQRRSTLPALVASKGLTECWRGAMAAKPSDWALMGIRCTSTGLAPADRSDGWIAEACGPSGACLTAEARSPEDALLALTVQLREEDLTTTLRGKSSRRGSWRKSRA
jgi:hypothetical protein